MTITTIIFIIILAVILSVISIFIYNYFSTSEDSIDMKGLMGRSTSDEHTTNNEDIITKKLKADASKKHKAKNKEKLDDFFFRAGMFLPEDKHWYYIARMASPIIGAIIGFMAATFVGVFSALGMLVIVVTTLFSTRIPMLILESKIKERHEDIMFYLPLIIEQIVIGVSSSLDIGPCISRVIDMADERDTHNPVSELLKIAYFQIKSGVPMEEAFNDIGIRSGHTELKHVFMSLAQVAKHGGEITRQLQELANAVSSQRESKIEEKIQKLELAATGPVAIVFFGFMIILLVGFGIQMLDAFK